MESKFLADGRKVVIVGQLNQQEWIVQEVFVTDSGDEIPAGERFTTKSLLDQPAKSYKQKELEKLEARIEKCQQELKRYSKEISERHVDLQASREVAKCLRKYTGGSMDEGSLQNLTDFLTGNIAWLVSADYGHNDPEPFQDAICRSEHAWGGERKFDSLRLLSLFGSSNGDLMYRLHPHGDAYGNGDRKVYGFRTYEEAARKSIELTISEIKKGKSDTARAEELLKSTVRAHMTQEEVALAKSVIKDCYATIDKGYDKQAADLEANRQKRLKEISKLIEL